MVETANSLIKGRVYGKDTQLDIVAEQNIVCHAIIVLRCIMTSHMIFKALLLTLQAQCLHKHCFFTPCLSYFSIDFIYMLQYCAMKR